MPIVPPRTFITLLNSQLNLEELLTFINVTADGKSSGRDGIPAEV